MTDLAITVPAQGIHARLTLSLHPRLTVLVGPNGSGKTRILERLAETDEPVAERAILRAADAPFLPLVTGAASPAKRRRRADADLLVRIFPDLDPSPAGAQSPDGPRAIRALADALARHPDALALIDLPELFLDPDAQRRVMPALLDAFPNTRFVIATHSPLVAASVRDARLYRMTRPVGRTGIPGKWTTVESDLHREAMAPQAFLRDAMGFPATLPLWTEQAMRDHETRTAGPAAKRADPAELWAELKRQAEEAGIGRLLPATLRAFLDGVRR